MKRTILYMFILFLASCVNEKSKVKLENETKVSSTKYAKGFVIKKEGSKTIIEIKAPWPNSTKSYTYEFDKSELPIKRIVVTSTTHLPALEFLGVENNLVGFPGTDYVSSEKTRILIDNGKVKELGRNGDINTEILIELKPDLVIGYGVDGVSKTFETIEKVDIPVIYNGDWVEKTALGKAEWIKFFGVLFNKEKEADSIFRKIESEYLIAKDLVKNIDNKPAILCGALHKDVWYLPSGTSPEGQFLNDANTNYIWSDSDSKGSLPLSFETVLEKAKEADIWLSPSYYTSYSKLLDANEHYSQFSAFKERRIYSFSNTTGATGGVLYYELGTARPDLVLKDIIKICYPNILPDYETTFFKPLN